MPALLKDTMTLRGGPLTLIKKCRVAPCSTGLILSFFLQLPFPSRPQGEEAVKREEKMSPIRVQTSSGSFIQDTPIKDGEFESFEHIFWPRKGILKGILYLEKRITLTFCFVV